MGLLVNLTMISFPCIVHVML